MDTLRLAVLISGRGSNLQALIDACNAPDYPAEIVLVLSNRESARGLERATDAGIETAVIQPRDFDNREDFDSALNQRIRESGATLVCLAGFLWLLGEDFVHAWRDRLLNIHPSLLPAFRGLNVQAQAVEMGVRYSGCTVHYVRSELDDGPIIAQAVVPVLADDTDHELSARILEQEHVLYPRVVRWIAEGKVRVSGGRVLIDDTVQDPTVLTSPLDSA